MNDEPTPPTGTDDNESLLALVQPHARKALVPEDPSIQVEMTAKILLPLVVLLCLLVSFLMIQVGGLNDNAVKARDKAQEAISETAKNRKAGLELRATTCTLSVSVLGKDATSKSCFRKDVLALYDPDTIPPVASPDRQIYNTRLLCGLLYPDDLVAQQKCSDEAD